MVEGTKSVIELLRSDLSIDSLWATESWIRSHENEWQRIKPNIITAKEMERITTLKTPQEVLAVAGAPSYTINHIDRNAPLLILEAIRDPGNLGTIVRTADWFGITQILASLDTVELTNPKTIQATMGSFSRVKVVYNDLSEYLEGRKDAPLYGTFMQGTALSEVKFPSNGMILIGNEANGISEALYPFITERISIPTHSHTAESLNASIAAAIVLYEASKGSPLSPHTPPLRKSRNERR